MAVKIFETLVDHYPSRAKHEFPTRKLTANRIALWKRPGPTFRLQVDAIRNGRIDIVVASDSSMLVPQAMIEAKLRVASLAALKADLDRMGDLLRVLDPKRTPDLMGISVFPLQFKGPDSRSLLASLQVTTDRIEGELQAYASRRTDLLFELYSLDAATVFPPEPEYVEEAGPDPIAYTDASITVPMAVTIMRR